MTTQIQPLREKLSAVNVEIGQLLEFDPNTGQAKVDDKGAAIVPDWTPEQESRYESLTTERANIMAHMGRVQGTLDTLAAAETERRTENEDAGKPVDVRIPAPDEGNLGMYGQPESRYQKLVANFGQNVRARMANRIGQEKGLSHDEAFAGPGNAADTMLAFETALIHGERGLMQLEKRLGRDFMNILEVDQTSAPKGGIVTPKEVSSMLWELMTYYAPYMTLGTIVAVNHGRKVGEPTTDDTSNAGEILAESAAITSQDVEFDEVEIQPRRFSSKEALFTWDWVNSQVLSDATGRIYALLAERLGRTLSTACFLGNTAPAITGIKGAVEAANTSIATASGTKLDPADMDDAYFGVDTIYRGDSSFIMHLSTLAHLAGKTISSSDLRHLLTPDLQNGNLMRYRGRPLIEDNNSDEIPNSASANNEVVHFGPVRNLVIKPWTGSGVSYRWAEESTYAKKNQIGVAQVQYYGVGVLLAAAWSYLTLKAS